MQKPISLTVHKNTIRERHHADIRRRLKQHLKDAPHDAEGFLIIGWRTTKNDTDLDFFGGLFKDHISARLGLNDALREQLEEMLEATRQAAIGKEHKLRNPK